MTDGSPTTSISSKTWPPEDAPVCGRHLQEFRARHDYTVSYLVGIFGITSAQAYYKLVKAEDRPLPDIAMAVIVRWYGRHPQALPWHATATAEIADKLSISPEALAVTMGRNPLSGVEWVTGAAKPLSTVRNLLHEINRADEYRAPLESLLKRVRQRAIKRDPVSWEKVAEEIEQELKNYPSSQAVHEEIKALHAIERRARGERIPMVSGPMATASGQRRKKKGGAAKSRKRRLGGSMIEEI